MTFRHSSQVTTQVRSPGRSTVTPENNEHFNADVTALLQSSLGSPTNTPSLLEVETTTAATVAECKFSPSLKSLR